MQKATLARANNNPHPSAAHSQSRIKAAVATKVTPNRYGQNGPSISKASSRPKPYQHHLSVDKKIIDELLLVCGVIGSTVDPKTQKIVPVEDCLNWLQDLQRALRRDEDAYRSISLLLGQWKVVQQKLIPLVLSCRYDTPLVLTIVKILVILTKPLSQTAINAGRLVIDTKNRSIDSAVIKEQIKLRDNAIAQANLLTEYKKMFVHHPSHRTSTTNTNKKESSNGSKRNNNKAQKQESKGLLSIFVSLLAEPLSRTGMMRSNEDHLTVELILHLFRNLLCAGEPLLKDADKAQSSTKLHQESITLFEKEMVLDILLVIGQEMESRENKQYNLLVMEILHHILKNQDPTLVARSVLENESKAPSNNRGNHARSYSSRSQGSQSASSGLKSKLQKERNRLYAANSSRHSHFGGTLVVQKKSGQQQFVAAGIQSSSNTIRSQADIKRKTKKHQHIIGSGRSMAAYSRPGAGNASSIYAGPTSHRAQCVLNSFCTKFLSQCYGPVMKSLKNEFRRESNRLEEEDKVIFFRIIWFFSQWWRVTMSESNCTKSQSMLKKSVGQLIFTMDVFTFNLVLVSGDFYLEHKKYKNLAQVVSLYTEMVRLLHVMYDSSDSTEQIMALGLMDRLFYQSEPIDRLPKLLSRWIPGTFTVEYLCDLVELIHMTLKLLDRNQKVCENVQEEGKKIKRRAKKDEEEVKDAVSRMKATAAEFDTVSYLARKIVSNQVVFMLTQLLSQYTSNATHINDHIICFFIRLCKFVVAKDDFYDADETGDLINTSKVTLEPMLFNINLMMVLNEILNDKSLRNSKEFEPMLNFASTLVKNFAKASEENPMLYVETLFRHPTPHRFCENFTNFYVSEELRMIAEREVLMEQQTEADGFESKQGSSLTSIRDDEDEEEEMEFVDDDEIISKGTGEKHDRDETDGKDDSLPNVQDGAESDLDLSKHVDEIDDENDERWNDRRAFVPKRKRIIRNDDSENDNISSDDDAEDKPQQTSEPSGKKRIKRAIIEDLSDEEEEFGDTQITSFDSKKSSQSHFLEDSDDE